MSVIWSGVTEEGAVVPVQVTAEGKVVAVGDGPEGDYLKLTGGNLTGDLTVNEQITLATDGNATFDGDVGIGNIELNADGSAEFAGVVSALSLETDPLGGGVKSYRSVGGTAQVWRGGQSSSILTSEIAADGSATFAGVGRFGILSANPGSGDDGIIINPNQGVLVTADNLPVFRGYALNAATPTSTIDSDGSATFAGGNCGFTSAGELIFTSRNTRYKLVVSNGVCVAEEFTRQMELKEKAERFIADKRETKPSDPGPQVEVTPDNDNA